MPPCLFLKVTAGAHEQAEEGGREHTFIPVQESRCDSTPEYLRSRTFSLKTFLILYSFPFETFLILHIIVSTLPPSRLNEQKTELFFAPCHSPFRFHSSCRT
jgi:hypothetical protein